MKRIIYSLLIARPHTNENNHQNNSIARSIGNLTTLIKSIYSKNNNYLVMDRAYEDDKTLALVKNYWFRIVVLPKKNRKLPGSYDRHLYKQCNNIERYFLRLKCFRKVFTRYDKLDSIFISTISLAFIFDSLFM